MIEVYEQTMSPQQYRSMQPFMRAGLREELWTEMYEILDKILSCQPGEELNLFGTFEFPYSSTRPEECSYRGSLVIRRKTNLLIEMVLKKLDLENRTITEETVLEFEPEGESELEGVVLEFKPDFTNQPKDREFIEKISSTGAEIVEKDERPVHFIDERICPIDMLAIIRKTFGKDLLKEVFPKFF